MKKLKLILIIIIFNISYGISQTEKYNLSMDDALRVIKAIGYLNENINKNFVMDSLEFSGIYKDMLHMVTFEIKNQYKSDNKNMIIVFIDYNVIDTINNTKISKIDIKRYYNGKYSNNIYYNKAYALNLAKEINFEKGNKEWICELKGVMDDVSWNIYSTTFEQVEHPHQCGGKCLKVNLRSGKYEINEWYSIE